jgi:hypothetical protein
MLAHSDKQDWERTGKRAAEYKHTVASHISDGTSDTIPMKLMHKLEANSEIRRLLAVFAITPNGWQKPPTLYGSRK